MAEGTNMNVVEAPQQSHHHNLRGAIRARIADILRRKIPQRTDAASQHKVKQVTMLIDNKLYSLAKKEEDYSDLRNLEMRVNFILRTLTTLTMQQRYAKMRSGQQSVTPTHGMGTGITSTNTNLAAGSNVQSGSLPPINGTTGGSSFNGFQQVSAGFPISSSDSTMPVFNRTANSDGGNVSARAFEPQRQQTASSDYNMVGGGWRPNIHQVTSQTTGFGIRGNSVPLASGGPRTSYELPTSTHFPTSSTSLVQRNYVTSGICSPQATGFGIGTNSVPLASGSMTSYGLISSTHMPTLSTTPMVQRNYPSDSFGSNILYGVVPSSGSMAVSPNTIPSKPNPVQRVISFHQLNLPENPLPKRQELHEMRQSASPVNGNLAQVSQQHSNHQGQHSQQIYSGQMQKQDQFRNVDAYRTQMATGLATSVNHEPSLYSCKEAALQQQTVNGFRPSQSQYQQNAVKDHSIGAQSAPIRNKQLNSSPSSRANSQQKQSASVMVQRQSSLQNSSQIPVSNNGEREHIGVQRQSSLQNSIQISENNKRMGVNLCHRTPMQPRAKNNCSSAKPPTSCQTVSPRSTAEKNHLTDGNNKLSEQVEEDHYDKNKIRFLLFMFHVRSCTATGDKCESKYCSNGKALWNHLRYCKSPDCTYRYCVQGRELLSHYCNCKSKACRVCVCVNNFLKKQNMKHPKCQPRESSESMQVNNKRVAEAPLVDNDLQPSTKRLKLEQPSQNATSNTKSNSVSVRDFAFKSHPSMAKEEKDGFQSNECKSVSVEVKPMDIDVPNTSDIPVTVIEDTPKDKDGSQSVTGDKTVCLPAQGESKCMNETSAPKEENEKQSVKVADASKMEVSSLVELFTPEQVKEHIRGLRQWVGQSKTKAEKNKALGHTMSVNSCQLCAVERLVFEPIPIYCTPCGVRIKRNAVHYSVAAGETRHSVCAPCYNGVHENFISLNGNSIPKARLEKKKNDEKFEEGWVQCDKCLAWQHQICALFNGRRNHGEETKYTCPSCYIQEVEQGERKPLPESAIPGAKDLPVTALSNYIEQRLFKTLKKERQERARFQGKSYDEVPGAESLAVRVVASVDKVLEVKQHFLELFQEENYPSEFPYKSKAILLFQKIESVEVCLFGMFVQEFGTECGPPNQRRIYLSYLDSVKYFRPEVRTVSGEALRTFVYHEILIGYLDYCKKRGFTSCYIWACPPLKGEDYILYCHPEIQKTPKTDKLREWYLAMLRKASKEDVVVECTNLYDQFFVQSGESRANVTAARLPYFDGDYWPGAAEDLIQQMSQEGDGTKLNRKGSTKKVISKRALRAVGQPDLSVNASKDRLTMQKLGEIICPLKEDFIMVHLQHVCKHCCTHMVSGHRWVCKQCKNFQICDKCYEAEQKRVDEERHPIHQREKHTLIPVPIKVVPTKIEDKDDNIESEFFDNRQAFLALCQGNNYQYDTLRRAKHSSMMLLYHLHNPTVPAFATTCTICQQELENAQGWHCRVCPGYDVCNACYSKACIDHPHNLISRSSATDTGVQQKGQANQFTFDQLREMLLHASTCRTPQCQYHKCRQIRFLYKHGLACKTRSKDCLYCAKLWLLIQNHSRNCRDSKCTVPKCRECKANISRQQQQSDKRRRAAVMEMMRARTAETTRNS